MGKSCDDCNDWVSYPHAQADLSRCGFKLHVPLRHSSIELSSMINWDCESMNFFVTFLWEKYISQDDDLQHIFSHISFGRTMQCLPPILFLFSAHGVDWCDVHCRVSKLKKYLEYTAKRTVSHVYEFVSDDLLPKEVLTYLTSDTKKVRTSKNLESRLIC